MPCCIGPPIIGGIIGLGGCPGIIGLMPFGGGGIIGWPGLIFWGGIFGGSGGAPILGIGYGGCTALYFGVEVPDCAVEPSLGLFIVQEY